MIQPIDFVDERQDISPSLRRRNEGVAPSTTVAIGRQQIYVPPDPVGTFKIIVEGMTNKQKNMTNLNAAQKEKSIIFDAVELKTAKLKVTSKQFQKVSQLYDVDKIEAYNPFIVNALTCKEYILPHKNLKTVMALKGPSHVSAKLVPFMFSFDGLIRSLEMIAKIVVIKDEGGQPLIILEYDLSKSPETTPIFNDIDLVNAEPQVINEMCMINEEQLPPTKVCDILGERKKGCPVMILKKHVSKMEVNGFHMDFSDYTKCQYTFVFDHPRTKFTRSGMTQKSPTEFLLKALKKSFEGIIVLSGGKVRVHQSRKDEVIQALMQLKRDKIIRWAIMINETTYEISYVDVEGVRKKQAVNRNYEDYSTQQINIYPENACIVFLKNESSNSHLFALQSIGFQQLPVNEVTQRKYARKYYKLYIGIPKEQVDTVKNYDLGFMIVSVIALSQMVKRSPRIHSNAAQPPQAEQEEVAPLSPSVHNNNNTNNNIQIHSQNIDTNINNNTHTNVPPLRLNLMEISTTDAQISPRRLSPRLSPRPSPKKRPNISLEEVAARSSSGTEPELSPSKKGSGSKGKKKTAKPQGKVPLK